MVISRASLTPGDIRLRGDRQACALRAAYPLGPPLDGRKTRQVLLSTLKMSATEIESETYVHYHDGGVPGKRRVLTGKAALPTFNEVPKIDMRRIYSDNIEDRKELAEEVGAACRDVGFFYAVNHGVDQHLLDDTFSAVKRFFDLPTEVKMEVHNQKTEKFRG